jgi:hypothetical protein
MALLLLESEALHLLRCHLPTGRVAGVLPRRPDHEARRRGGVADQGHDDLPTPQRSPAPSLGMVAPHPVRQLVPLPRPRGQGAHREASARLIRPTWALPRPPAAPAAVGATARRREEEPLGLGRGRLAPLAPPAPARLHGTRGGGLAQRRAGTGVARARRRLSLRRPRAPTLAARADPGLLGGIDRAERLAWWLAGVGPTGHGRAGRRPCGLGVPRQGRRVGLATGTQGMEQRGGSGRLTGWRPPPRRRHRAGGAGGPDALSARASACKPARLVPCESPVASATRRRPPHPMARASTAAHLRRARSAKSGLKMETIASVPDFGMAPEGPVSYSSRPNMRARRTKPWSVRACIDPIPPKG